MFYCIHSHTLLDFQHRSFHTKYSDDYVCTSICLYHLSYNYCHNHYYIHNSIKIYEILYNT